MNVKESLKLLFDRPSEPLITPKGDQRALFHLTEQFLTEEYANNGIELNNRFGNDASVVIPLKNLSQVPDLTISRQLPKDADFSLFLPRHQEMASEVINVLLQVPENQLDDFLSTCVFSRANLNPQLFNYCYSVALMHR
ncbi:Phenoloxidase subunit 2 [Eumeta japonica]|uniref:Phenoloxidase subunit 2 n=1 Tax=Eumeta variegata TaxID=151549 RepID=A0A4C1Y6K8_EUMVA|nr:Phenoloxidase subunit 2 [Eumeta japonica]